MKLKDFTLKELFIINLLIFMALIVGFVSGFNVGQLTNVTVTYEYENPFGNISWYPENVSDYNYEVMRDLFTPAYNDSVTVEQYGYVNSSWVYWVNHSRVLSSYYFDDMQSYKVAFPLFGKIYLLETHWVIE